MCTLFLILLYPFLCVGVSPGPEVLPTKGEVWPKPQHEEKSEDYYIIKPYTFSFKVVPENIGCPNFLDNALTRYWAIIATSALKKRRGIWITVENLNEDFESRDQEHFLGYLENLTVQLDGECLGEDIFPTLEDRENYVIKVDAAGATLSADSIWGILRGLETFSQLIHLDQDSSLVINATTITDFPRFAHRGLLIDTARHFEPVLVIFQMLDAMAFNKMNVFHWHITDDSSFSYRSRTFPELSENGAYDPVEAVYEQSDVRRVIEYARLRGIRVVPEFDTPGHTASWGLSHPELLTTCYSGDEPNGNLGPLNPSINGTYDFIDNFFTEVVEVFPDSYFHIGGDEVDFECWQSNPEIGAFMANSNISTYEELENYYIQRVVDLVNSLNSQYIVWEEVFVNNVFLPNSTLVHIWKTNGLSTLSKVVQAGKHVLYSTCWYLSDVQPGSNWDAFYRCEPLLLIHDEAQRGLVLGGEACMWGEYVNEFSIIPRVWPRASAVAERLWSAEDVKDVEDAQRRLEEHACRMSKRGIGAQPPNGPGMCF